MDEAVILPRVTGDPRNFDPARSQSPVSATVGDAANWLNNQILSALQSVDFMAALSCYTFRLTLCTE
ncbi:MAG: hypothetical protein JWL65_960 [Gammaproteobacteria bacterium]|nr:hypothetical protein [Gammaproteobacteria bacterium]